MNEYEGPNTLLGGYGVIEYFVLGEVVGTTAFQCFFLTPQTGESDIDNVCCPPTDEFERILRENFSGKKFQLQSLQICSPTPQLCSPTPGIILIQGAFQH